MPNSIGTGYIFDDNMISLSRTDWKSSLSPFPFLDGLETQSHPTEMTAAHLAPVGRTLRSEWEKSWFQSRENAPMHLTVCHK